MSDLDAAHLLHKEGTPANDTPTRATKTRPATAETIFSTAAKERAVAKEV
jgi:hypothetical protein